VFVGTSFSVGITQTAIEIATTYQKPVYSFNLFEEAISSMSTFLEYLILLNILLYPAAPFPLINVYHVVGKAEIALPYLCNLCFNSQELYFIPSSLVEYVITVLL
jgi:hypothetical protein